jgi:putative transposase
MITKYGAFCLENLNIRGMLKNHKLAKAIQDAAWGEFVRTLEYKASALGKPVIRVGQWFPSSQLCSECGARQLMPLNKREYICEACGLATCRDLNAARNIQAEGIKGMIKNAII